MRKFAVSRMSTLSRTVTRTWPTDAPHSGGPRVFVTRSDFPKSGIDLLDKRLSVSFWPSEDVIPREEFCRRATGTEALFVSLSDKIGKEVIDAAGPNLKVISTMSAGVDHIDLRLLKERGIRLGHTPDVQTEATSELAVALLLATSRRVFEANDDVRTGGWRCWSPQGLCGPGLNGSVVGVVGYGKIGESVASKLMPFGVSKVLYTRSSDKPPEKDIGAARTDLDDLLRQSDFVVVTCALNRATRNLFNARKFSIMKPTSIFVNVSRGGVVDQEALIWALKTGVIGGAGLDVTTPEPLPRNHELLKLKNCVILPHIGNATWEARSAMSVLAAKNILAALEGREMPAEYPL